MKSPRLFIAAAAFFLALASAAQADPYKDAVLDDKPFAYYRLSESSSDDPAADETGRNPGSYVNNPKVGVPGAIATDRENTAVEFSRNQSQFIKLTNFGNFGSGMSSGFTVEYWLKTEDSTDHQNVFGAANGPNFKTDFLVDIAYHGKQERLRLYCRDNHWNRFEANFYPGGDNADIFDGHWHYIVHVYDPKGATLNDQVLLYIDGNRQSWTVGSKGRNVPEFSDFNEPLTLGAMDLRGKEPDFLEGSLDDVAFYVAPLSAAQIMKHYEAAGGRERAPLGK